MQRQPQTLEISLQKYLFISGGGHAVLCIIIFLTMVIFKDHIDQIEKKNLDLIEKSVTVDLVAMPKIPKPVPTTPIISPGDQTKNKVAPLQAGKPDAKPNQILKKALPNKGEKDVLVDRVVDSNKKTSFNQNRASGKTHVGGATKASTIRQSGEVNNKNNKGSSGGMKKTNGTTDFYKLNDLASSLNGQIAKTGSFKEINVKSSNEASGADGDTDGGSLTGTKGAGATLKTAKVEHQSGSVSGLASGKLDETRGLGGIVQKGSFVMADMPSTTIVMGGMDPESIRSRLMEHLSQFRFCYQKVLDRTQEGFSGVVKLNFMIGASGSVISADAKPYSGTMPDEVRTCVVNVLRGISFPEPPSRGKVEVSQPINFYPKTR